MTPDPWDWTPVRDRVTGFEAARIHALDEVVADVRAHVRAAGICQPSREHAEALWLGARLAIGILEPLLRVAVAGDPEHVIAHIDPIEEICCAARDLWPPAYDQRRPSSGA